MSEEIKYRQDKKKYKDKNLKFAEEGRRYKPRKRRRARVLVVACIAAAAAVAVLAAIFIFGNKNNEALSDNIMAAVKAPAVSAGPVKESTQSSAPQQTAPASEPSAPEPSPVAAAAKATEPPQEEINIEPPADVPFVYENNGQVMLAGGGKSITLGGHDALYGCYQSINAMLSGDNRCLYYIAGTDIATGAGTLMKAAADASGKPETVAEGVCTAQASYDGSQVMYFKNMQGALGTLYLMGGAGEELIAENAVPDFFEFSPGGRSICYFTKESDGSKTLYVKSTGKAPVLVAHITAETAADGGVSLTRVSVVIPFDNGDVLYSAEENYNMPLYLFTHGNVSKICEDGYVVKTFADGGFLYGETGLDARPLWYKAPDSEPVMISENYDYVTFPDAATDSAWFLLVERIGDGADNPGVMMYVISKDKIKAAISLADSEGIDINSSFDCVTYERASKLYASRSTDGGWKETFLSDASSQQFQGAKESGMHAQFDETGANLYFADELNTGPLYRFAVQDGSITKLVNKVDWFRVTADTVFAHTTNDKLYRCRDGVQMIAEGVRELYAAQGGTYAVTDEGILFIGAGAKAKKMGSYTNSIDIPGSITCQIPLEQDAAAALGVLAREANYCLYRLGYFRDEYEQPLKAEDAFGLAGKLLARDDLEPGTSAVVQDIYDGLSAYMLWTRGGRKARSGQRRAGESFRFV